MIKHHKHLILTTSVGRSLSSSHTTTEDMVFKGIVFVFILVYISLGLFALGRLDFSLGFWNVLCEFHPLFTCSFLFGFLDRWLGILRLLSHWFGTIHVVELIECLDVLGELLNSLLLLPRLLPFLTTYVRPQSPQPLGLHLLLNAIEFFLSVRLVIAVVDDRLTGLCCSK